MSAQENKAIIKQYVEQVFNQGDLAVIEQYVAASYVRHDPGAPTEVRGPEGVRQLAAASRAGFPDIHITA